MRDFKVNIQKLTKVAAKQSFGLILLLDTEHDIPYTICEDMQAVLSLVPIGSKAYKIANRIFQQRPKPARIAIVGTANKEFVAGTKAKHTLTVATDFVAGDALTVNGTTYTCVQSGAKPEKQEFNVGTKQSQINELKPMLEKAETEFAVESTATTIIFTQKRIEVGELPVVETSGTGKASIQNTTPAVEEKGMIPLLTKAANQEESFFYLVTTTNTNADIMAISEWIDTQEKMYFVTSQSILSAKLIRSEQTVVMYHNDENAYAAEGLVSYLATAKAGGVTAKFKEIKGVESASITKENLDILHKNNGFTYLNNKGVLQTTEGKTTSGEYIDVVIGSFWIQFQMEAAMAKLAAENGKIGYDNAGIALIVSTCKSVLNKAANEQDIILRDKDGKPVFAVDYVSREDSDKNEVANRRYNGVSWHATLAGAIHGGEISGVLEY